MSEIKKTIERYNWDLDDYMIRAYEADDGKWVAYEDVADLITENERLDNEDARTRHALKGWVFVCPDGGAEPTHERVAAVVAEVERLRAEVERLYRALYKIAGKVPFADDPWTIARKALDRREGR